MRVRERIDTLTHTHTHRFTREENVGAASLVKSSGIRGIKAKIVEQMPAIEPIINVLIPKKAPLHMVKW